jgi:hypothetical protein
VMAVRARSGSVDDSGVRSTTAGHRASSTAGRNVVPARISPRNRFAGVPPRGPPSAVRAPEPSPTRPALGAPAAAGGALAALAPPSSPPAAPSAFTSPGRTAAVATSHGSAAFVPGAEILRSPARVAAPPLLTRSPAPVAAAALIREQLAETERQVARLDGDVLLARRRVEELTPGGRARPAATAGNSALRPAAVRRLSVDTAAMDIVEAAPYLAAPVDAAPRTRTGAGLATLRHEEGSLVSVPPLHHDAPPHNVVVARFAAARACVEMLTASPRAFPRETVDHLRAAYFVPLLTVAPGSYGRYWPEGADAPHPTLLAVLESMSEQAIASGPVPGAAALVDLGAVASRPAPPRALVDNYVGYNPSDPEQCALVSQPGVAIIIPKMTKSTGLGWVGKRPADDQRSPPLPYKLDGHLSMDRLLAAVLGDASDARILADDAAVEIWLGNSVSLNRIDEPGRRLVRAALLKGRVPALQDLATRYAPRPTTDKADLLATVRFLADIFAEVYGPASPLTHDVRAMCEMDTLALYIEERDAHRALGISEAPAAVAAQFARAADAWFTAAYRAVTNAYRHCDLLTNGAVALPHASVLPRLTTYLPLEPVAERASMYSFMLECAAAQNAQQRKPAATAGAAPGTAGPDVVLMPATGAARRGKAPARTSNDATAGRGPPAAAAAPAGTNESPTIAMTRGGPTPACVTAARAAGYTTAREAMAAVPELRRLVCEGKMVCVRRLLFAATTEGCRSDRCERHHLE